MRNVFLLVLILALSGLYYWKNLSKVQYSWSETKGIYELFSSGGNTGDIIKVDIRTPQYSDRWSFVKETVLDDDGTALVFVKIPEEVGLGSVKGSIYVDDKNAPIESQSQYFLMLSVNGARVYIVNSNYNQVVADVIQDRRSLENKR